MSPEWKNLRNERIRYAYNGCVMQVKNSDKTDKEKGQYRADVRGYGASVHRQGLMQDLSGRISDIDKAHSRMFVLHILRWLFREAVVESKKISLSDTACEKADVLPLFRHLLNEPEDKLPYYTQEATMLVDEIKRFAETELPSPDDKKKGKQS